MRPYGLSKAAAGVALAVLLAACSSADAGNPTKSQAAAAPTLSTQTSLAAETTTSASTTTTEEATTTSTKPVASASQSIPSVKALQQRLADLGYDIGTPDGQWGARTSYSLMAFQKVEGLSVDGQDGPQTEAALATAHTPGPMVPGGAPTRIEIDVARQVLFYWVDGSLARILPVSTGSGEHYCVDGACDVAVTPGGNFRIGRKAVGLEVAPLGELWWPMYFNGGIAIHGSPSVPAYPASHGCVRIPMYAAPTFYDQVAPGTRVQVLNSPEAEAPPDLGKPVPNAVAPPDTTPTTEAPAVTTTSTVAVPDSTTTTSVPVAPTLPTSTTTTSPP